MSTPKQIHLGYEVGTGSPVEVPLAHTFVTGQTQLSGKTTTLRALVGRSGCRALVFITKRGEHFEGRRIDPYLPREGSQPIHWRLVETILASALGQRAMKYERYWLIQAAKGATSLAGVRTNVNRLLAKSKGGRTEEAYTLIREYLDLVVPDMAALGAADVLDLQPGLNVMDLSRARLQLQALVIRAALEQINQHEKGVLTVFPEAWEFAPRGRSAPAKDEAVAMARKGAVLGNYLLCDSQDIAGVETTIRQAASVWILGVQRELNELKRTIDSIPAGIAKPKSADVATLGLGQFYACWGRHAVKTYVQPEWMTDDEAQRVARGEAKPSGPPPPAAPVPKFTNIERIARQEAILSGEPYPQPEPEEFDMADLKQVLEGIDALKAALAQHGAPVAAPVAPAAVPVASSAVAGDMEGVYQYVLGRLRKEQPAILQVLAVKPELHVKVERQVIEVNGDSLRGRLARLIIDDFFDAGVSGTQVQKELSRRGYEVSPGSLYPELGALAAMGFLVIEEGDKKEKKAKKFQAIAGMKANVKEAKS